MLSSTFSQRRAAAFDRALGFVSGGDFVFQLRVGAAQFRRCALRRVFRGRRWRRAAFPARFAAR